MKFNITIDLTEEEIDFIKNYKSLAGNEDNCFIEGVDNTTIPSQLWEKGIMERITSPASKHNKKDLPLLSDKQRKDLSKYGSIEYKYNKIGLEIKDRVFLQSS